MQTHLAIIDSPIGKLQITTAHGKIQTIQLLLLPASSEIQHTHDSFTQEVIEQLQAYFKNPAHVFNLALQIEGSTFKKTVWQHLQQIPSGMTQTYTDLAKKLKSGPRAIGNACRHNPLLIVIPCHRIIAKSGLGGFCGSTKEESLVIKQWLLNHEKVPY